MYSCPVPCGVFQSARTSPELRPNMQFGIRHNRQSAGDHSDHVTCHTNNEAWVRYEYILGFWDYSGIVSIKSTKRINAFKIFFVWKMASIINIVDTKIFVSSEMKLIGWETLLRRKEAILTKIKVTKMFDALLSQFLRPYFVRKYTTLWKTEIKIDDM